MTAKDYTSARKKLYEKLPVGALFVLFSGGEIRKTNDEYYPYFADRNFVYLTGLTACKEAVLLAGKTDEDTVWERLYLLPADPMAERWTGRRLPFAEAEALTGIVNIRPVDAFTQDLHAYAASGTYHTLYLDLFRVSPSDIDRPAHHLFRKARSEYPRLAIGNANALLRALRLIKTPNEIAALRKAEAITREGILAMMRASKPGMYEYQYKAEFDHALWQFSPDGPGFPSIISAGKNNFCIHYYDYAGQAQDGDMVLNDVGAQWNNMICDVSRAFPCNGRFTEQQKLLFDCALLTSDHLFSIIRPGMPMADVDKTIHAYCGGLLRDAGILGKDESISKLMWHGGAHHIGYDVHDVVATPETLAPNMVFCVDVGIYHEEWGIGFRLEDNCLVTESGCENLSAAIPRTPYDIENAMRRS